MATCSACGERVEASFRYCPWCAAPLRLKLVDFFRPHPSVEPEQNRALRVSRYLGAGDDERHVRFSVWNETGRAEAAISVTEDEAARLAWFLGGQCGSAEPRRLGDFVRQLRLTTRRLVGTAREHR